MLNILMNLIGPILLYCTLYLKNRRLAKKSDVEYSGFMYDYEFSLISILFLFIINTFIICLELVDLNKTCMKKLNPIFIFVFFCMSIYSTFNNLKKYKHNDNNIEHLFIIILLFYVMFYVLLINWNTFLVKKTRKLYPHIIKFIDNNKLFSAFINLSIIGLIYYLKIKYIAIKKRLLKKVKIYMDDDSIITGQRIKIKKEYVELLANNKVKLINKKNIKHIELNYD